MKLLFVHLSDTHFSSKQDVSFAHIQMIINSLHEFDPFDYSVFIVSGDLTSSGQKDQYTFARYLLGNINKYYYDQYQNAPQPQFLLVPGNHDVDLGRDPLTHERLQELYNNNCVDSMITSEIRRQQNFNEFSRSNGCFSMSEQLFCRRFITFGSFKMEANLLNSAIFSMYDEEKGLHFFPPYVFNKYNEKSDANFIISIMHHSFHWFNDKQKQILESIILSRSNLVFFGHEHHLVSQAISYDEHPLAKVFAGGKLCDKGDWQDSEYGVCLFDTDTRSLIHCGFRWNKDRDFYISNPRQESILPIKLICNGNLLPTKNFMEHLLKDPKNSITNNVLDYFVFPRLQLQKRGEYTDEQEYSNEDEFINVIEKHKKIYITGSDDSGKTTLLKRIFMHMFKEKIVLFCNVDDIKSGNRRLITQRVFQEIYGEKIEDYACFCQFPKDQKVIIIDDVHKVSPAHLSSFIKGIEDDFEYIILGSKTSMELDIVDRIMAAARTGYSRYNLMPFFSDKRKELIAKLVPICSTRKDEDYEYFSGILSEALNRQRTFITFNPNIILQYVQFYCKNMQDVMRNDGGVFGKVFEANITNSVSQHLTKNISIEKLYIVLDKIAYHVHKQKIYPIPQSVIASVIEEYNQRYDGKINMVTFLDIVIKAKIIVECENETTYRFNNKSHLAFFVAREILRRFQESREIDDLVHALEFACFGINADILIMLTYISGDKNMLHIILKSATDYVKDWEEFNLNPGNIPFITNSNPFNVKLPSLDEIKKRKKQEIAEEKKDIEKLEMKIYDIYDYDENDISSLQNQILRAFALMSVVSRCLPNFEHMMLTEDKKQFVKAIYSLPLKVFYRWAIEIEKNKAELIKVIKEINETEYTSRDELTVDDIIRRMQTDAICFFLNTIFVAVAYSTKENTIDYLEAYDYDTMITHQIMHLMMLENREKIEEFISASAKLYDSSKSAVVSNLIKRIAQHFLLYSKKLDQRNMQRLEEQFFDGGRNHQQLLAQRNMASRK